MSHIQFCPKRVPETYAGMAYGLMDPLFGMSSLIIIIKHI